MKKCFWAICLGGLICAGCAAHSYRHQGDRLILSLKNLKAREVYFYHNLDGFQQRKAVRKAKGIWEVSIAAERSFTYFYRVDGKIFVPDCELKESDDFGSENCVFEKERAVLSGTGNS